MANRWEKVEAVTDFIFFGSKIAGDGDSTSASVTMINPLGSHKTLEKSLKRWEIPDHLTYLLRNQYAGQ